MCILILKKKGYKLPTKEVLKTCFNNNNDGCGYAFSISAINWKIDFSENQEKEKNKQDQNIIIIKKGFFKFEDFYKSLREDYKKYNLIDKNLLLHFRIGTSGGITEDKTHPFILSNKSKEVNKYKNIMITSKAVAGHNGVLNNYVYGGLSDTQNYIKDFLYYVYKSNLEDNIKNKIIKDSLDGDKLIILNIDGTFKKYGDFIEKDGVLYSNTSYKERYYYTSKNYQSIYDYDFYKYDLLEDTKTKRQELDNEMYNYIKDNLKEIKDNTIYCDGYFFDRDKDYQYYLDEKTGEIWELNKEYRTTSFIGNNYY